MNEYAISHAIKTLQVDNRKLKDKIAKMEKTQKQLYYMALALSRDVQNSGTQDTRDYNNALAEYEDIMNG